MAVFVSYARLEKPVVTQLCDDLRRLGRDAWFDDHIAPAEEWWDEILEQIRSCELFVIALSESWRNSPACRAELQYALDLGRPLLPVLVGDVDMNTVPPEVSEMNARPFNAEDRSSVFNLALALKAAPAVQSLPDPLPAAPPPPMTNVAHLTEWLQVPELSFRDQQTLLAELQGLLNGADTR